MATTLPVQRHPRSLFPEFSELFAAFPSFAGLRPTFDTRLMRLEDEMKEGRYEVRAELPGSTRPRTSTLWSAMSADHQGRAHRAEGLRRSLGIRVRFLRSHGVAAGRC